MNLSPTEEDFLMSMLIKTIDSMPPRLLFGMLGYMVSRLESLGIWTPGLESKIIDSLIPDSGEKEVVQ